MSLLFKKRVMTPGPTDVPPDVLMEMAQPIIHHRTKAFQAIYKEMSEGLQKLFRTSSPGLTIAGSGTTSFEAAQVSLMEPGKKALTIAGGKFGERWQDIYDTYGVEQVKINVPWGEAADPAQIWGCPDGSVQSPLLNTGWEAPNSPNICRSQTANIPTSTGNEGGNTLEISGFRIAIGEVRTRAHARARSRLARSLGARALSP